MKTIKIFFTRKLPERPLQELYQDSDFELDFWTEEHPITKMDLCEKARNSDVLVTLLSDNIDREVLTSLKGNLIAQYAVGVDNIDFDTANELGIRVTNTPGVLTESTADLAWTLLLGVARRLIEADNYVRKGLWKIPWGPKLLLGVELTNKTLGIIGLGRIGQAVARRAKGFKMHVLYTSRTEKTDFEQEFGEGIRKTSLEDLLVQSDFITVHVPLTAETRSMIGKKAFSLMKKTAIFINTARAAVVDETALFSALRHHQILGVGLDVFHQEPLNEENSLLKLDNVILAPHIGSATTETREKMVEIVIKNIKAHIKGESLPNLVVKG